MAGLSAILADLFILGVACFVLASAVSQYRQRKTAGTIALVALIGLVTFVLTVRLSGKFYYCLWLRSLEPDDVASITIGTVEVSDAGEKDKLIAAMNRSTWYFRSGNLDRAKPLVIRLRSGKNISCKVNYDRKHRGAAISFSGEYGLHYGWVFSLTLVEAAAELDISIPEKHSSD